MIKFIPLLSALLCLFTVSAQNISDLETFEKSMKPGTVITYDVNSGGKKYQFIATLKKVGDEIAFDWKMTEPINKTGSVEVTAGAVKGADALFNYFTGGDSKLDKETSVFVSQKIFKEIAATSTANIKVNGAADSVTVMSNTISEFNFNLNGNLVALPGWELDGGSEIPYIIGIIESGKFPLIVRMELGWTIQLAEIKTP